MYGLSVAHSNPIGLSRIPSHSQPLMGVDDIEKYGTWQQQHGSFPCPTCKILEHILSPKRNSRKTSDEPTRRPALSYVSWFAFNPICPRWGIPGIASGSSPIHSGLGCNLWSESLACPTLILDDLGMGQFSLVNRRQSGWWFQT